MNGHKYGEEGSLPQLPIILHTPRFKEKKFRFQIPHIILRNIIGTFFGHFDLIKRLEAFPPT